MAEASLRALAQSVLAKKWDSAWDKAGTRNENSSPVAFGFGTRKSEHTQRDSPLVPLSHALGHGQWDKPRKSGTEVGTSAGQAAVPVPYILALSALCERCPDHVEPDRWQRAVQDGRQFLAQWGEQAVALGWMARDLFGLHEVPQTPHASYRRLSRYDCTGLCWLLRGCEVVALTESTAAIRHPGGSVTTYRRFNKPPLGPVGDSLDDFSD